MGFRFRKSIKLAPGVKINLGKKSAGLSIGNKYGGMSINSKAGVRSRVSVPGTGMSYTQKIGGKREKESERETHPHVRKPLHRRVWYIALIIIFLLGSIGCIRQNIAAAAFGFFVSACLIFGGIMSIKCSK